jgi:DNA topoisomerase-2
MAQDFVGSNNLNLLTPNGQFGTRLEGGKDSASERYIFTQLSPFTRMIFPEADDAVLEYNHDDGDPIEPVYYVPILPMVLVNGCRGIGTGTSTNVLCYHPGHLIDYLVARLQGSNDKLSLVPHYRGFQGTIDLKQGKYVVKGVYVKRELVIHLTELPIGVWTVEYKEHLESQIGVTIKEYTDNSTDKVVDMSIRLMAECDVEKVLKLNTTLSISNMNLFDADEHLKKYAEIHDIMEEYYDVRYATYEKRKVHQLKVLRDTLHKVEQKVKYIRAVLSGKLDLRNKKQDVLYRELAGLAIDMREESYSYLTKMPMDSVTQEKVEALEKEFREIQDEVARLTAMTVEQMWIQELVALKKAI